MSERQAMNANLVKLSKEGFRLFRNNVGKAWSGKSTFIKKITTVTLEPGDVLVRRARRIHFGLLKGSGDMIGYKTVKITEDMVGQEIAIFTSVEQKVKRGKRSQEQVDWDAAIKRAGGISLLLED